MGNDITTLPQQLASLHVDPLLKEMRQRGNVDLVCVEVGTVVVDEDVRDLHDRVRPCVHSFVRRLQLQLATPLAGIALPKIALRALLNKMEKGITDWVPLIT